MSRYVLVFVSSAFEKTSEMFKNLIWNDLKQQTQKHPNVRVLEIHLTHPSFDELDLHHKDLRRYVAWAPMIGLFEDESWVTPSLNGKVYGGTVSDTGVLAASTSQKPYDWLIRSIHQPRYVLVTHCNKHTGIGQRFLEGPWKKFLELLPNPEDYVIHTVDQGYINPSIPGELSRWLSWTPSVLVFTKESWDNGNLQGWVYQGSIDKHWSNDCVVNRDVMSDRYDHTDLLGWLAGIALNNNVEYSPACVEAASPTAIPDNQESGPDTPDDVLDAVIEQMNQVSVETRVLNESYIS